MLARIKLGCLGLSAVALILATSGCGSMNKGPKLKVEPVTGKVTLGGNPLPDAQLTLFFEGTPPEGFVGAGALTDAQGNFEVMTGMQKGAPAGTYKIVLSKMVGPDGNVVKADPATGMDLNQMIAAGTAKELIPPSHSDQQQSTVTVTVKEGTPTPPLNIEIPKG
jgi:hypothetical protein